MKKEKKCGDCLLVKKSDLFGKRNHKTGTVTLRSICKTCMCKRSVAWREDNWERYLAYQNKYRKAHR